MDFDALEFQKKWILEFRRFEISTLWNFDVLEFRRFGIWNFDAFEFERGFRRFFFKDRGFLVLVVRATVTLMQAMVARSATIMLHAPLPW